MMLALKYLSIYVNVWCWQESSCAIDGFKIFDLNNFCFFLFYVTRSLFPRTIGGAWSSALKWTEFCEVRQFRTAAVSSANWTTPSSTPHFRPSHSESSASSWSCPRSDASERRCRARVHRSLLRCTSSSDVLDCRISSSGCEPQAVYVSWAGTAGPAWWRRKTGSWAASRFGVGSSLASSNVGFARRHRRHRPNIFLSQLCVAFCDSSWRVV